MFSLFGSKGAKTKITDRVFISSEAKRNAMIATVDHNDSVVIVTWFNESYANVEELFRNRNQNVEIFQAVQIAAHNLRGKTVFFYEHHPLIRKENELLEKLQLKEAIFYSSLDEPLFKHFGGDRIVDMLEKMGMSENEAIEHSMISKAITNAQEKISRQIVVEHTAQSQDEWFSKNLVK